MLSPKLCSGARSVALKGRHMMCAQAQKVLGVQVESALMAAVEKSESLLRFGLFFQSPNARLRIQDKLQANLDLRMPIASCSPPLPQLLLLVHSMLQCLYLSAHCDSHCCSLFSAPRPTPGASLEARRVPYASRRHQIQTAATARSSCHQQAGAQVGPQVLSAMLLHSPLSSLFRALFVRLVSNFRQLRV